VKGPTNMDKWDQEKADYIDSLDEKMIANIKNHPGFVYRMEIKLLELSMSKVPIKDDPVFFHTLLSIIKGEK